MTTRDYSDAYEDDSENVRSWPAQDDQERSAAFSCGEADLEYRTALAAKDAKIEALENANKQLRADLRVAGDDSIRADLEITDLRSRLHTATSEVMSLLASRDAAWATIARMTLDYGHPSYCDCAGCKS